VSRCEIGALIEDAVGEDIEKRIDWRRIGEVAIVWDNCCLVDAVNKYDDKTLNEGAGGCERERQIEPNCTQDCEITSDASKRMDPVNTMGPLISWERDSKCAFDIDTRTEWPKSLEKSMQLESSSCFEPTSNVGCCLLNALQMIDTVNLFESRGVADNKKEHEAYIVFDPAGS
jgi:hypothetical protein